MMNQGREYSIAFNPEFLMALLRNLSDEEIFLNLIDERHGRRREKWRKGPDYVEGLLFHRVRIFVIFPWTELLPFWSVGHF